MNIINSPYISNYTCTQVKMANVFTLARDLIAKASNKLGVYIMYM